MKKLCSDFFMPQRLGASGLAIVHHEHCNKYNSKNLRANGARGDLFPEVNNSIALPEEFILVLTADYLSYLPFVFHISDLRHSLNKSMNFKKVVTQGAGRHFPGSGADPSGAWQGQI